MKRIFALILLLAFAAQTFSQSIVLLNFYINRAYIAKNQCENRNRPMLHCNGKCVLAKKMQEQEKKEQRQPELKLNAKSETVSSRSFFINVAGLSGELSNRLYPPFFESAVNGNRLSVFHPPCM